MAYAVRIENVSKMFRLYHENVQSLKEKILFFHRRGYEEFMALKDVSLDIEEGETLGIIGPNGSGKSTLLKCVSKILYPDKGKITVDGSVAALLELGAGFQPDLTGRENIYLNGSILGFSKKEIDKRYDDIVEFAELERFIDEYVRNYSSGMYVRLGFAIAINVDPDILIVDEVLTVGDEAFQRKCLNRIQEIKDAGKTIIWVTHAVDLTKEICDRVVMLSEGEIVKEGDPRDVVNYYHQFMEEESHSLERGNRRIEIEFVELLDEGGNPAEDFTTGESMRIRVHCHATEPVDDPVFGFSIEDLRGYTVYGTNTMLKSMDMGTVAGKRVVEFHLKSLPMLEGRYSVSATCHSRDQLTVYHWWENVKTFEVHSDMGDTGILYIPVEINVEIESS